MAKKQNKQKRNISKLLIIFLFIISLTMTAGTFAYWATNVEGTQSEAVGTLSIGSASGVSTKFILSNDSTTGGNLVPAGMNLSSEQNAVEEINLTYDIKWIEENITTQLEGTVTKGKIDVTHSLNIIKDGEMLDPDLYSNIYHLIVVTHSDSNPEELTLEADAKTFSFTITMEEPANQEEYNLIVNSEIQVIITYEITDEYVETIDDTTSEEPTNDSEDNSNTEDTSTSETEEEPDPSTYYEFYYNGYIYRYFYETGELVYVPYE